MNGAVLSGGGSSGCWTAGVLYRLFYEKEFAKIYGTSAGSLNAVLMGQAYVNGNPEIIKDIWTKKITGDKSIYSKKYWRLLFGKAPLTFKPLRNMIENSANFEDILKLKQEIIATSVDITTSQTFYASNKNSTSNVFKAALLASASVPFFTDPVEFGSKLLVDGGIKENAPVKKMLENKDINNILLILASPDQLNISKFNKDKVNLLNNFKILSRVLNIMTSEITNNDFKNVQHINDLLGLLTKNQIESNRWLKNKMIIKMDIIEPDHIIIDEILDFDPKKLRKGFDKGIKAAEKYLNLEQK